MVNKVHFSSSRSSQPRLFTTAPSRVPRWRSGKTSAGQCRSYKIPGFDSWVGKIPWSRKWQPTLQYSCLENSMDRGAWRATVHGITESDSTEHTHTHTHTHILFKAKDEEPGLSWQTRSISHPQGPHSLEWGTNMLLPAAAAAAAAAAAKSLQSCPILCDPIDGSPPGSPVPGTLQARTLEWVAISFSNA